VTGIPAKKADTGRFWEITAALSLLLASLSLVLWAPGPGADPDLWARVATGKLIVESGGVPVTDPFSYMPTRPKWIDHEWGSGLVFYAAATAFGEKGLLALKALLLFGTIWFMYRRASLAADRPASLTFHVIMTAALMFGFASTVRSQTFTFFLFAAWFHILERAWRGDWRAAPLIPLTAIPWANLHGGFLAGIGLLIIFAGAAAIERRQPARFAGLALAGGIGSLINPYGPSYWAYLVEAVGMDRPGVSEWTPMRLLGRDLYGHGFRVVLLLTIAALASHAWRRRRIELPTLLAISITLVLGLLARRHVTFFVITAVPFIWAWLAPQWQDENEGRSRWLSRALVTLIGLGLVATLPWQIPILRGYPADAVDFISARGLRGNLLIGFNTGSYAIWRLYPSIRVSLDGRYETVYPNETVEAVGRFFAGEPQWNRVLDAYPHDVVLVPRETAIETLMRTRPDWKIAFVGADDLVFVKAEASLPAGPALAPRGERSDPFATSGKPRFAPQATLQPAPGGER
jgi:hypothetical protein